MGDGVLENVQVVGGKRTFPRSFGRYVLEKSLSRGGMGEVFLTVAKAMNQRCVIKTIRGDLTGDEEFVGRFADEAKIMMRIQHQNIIRVFDAGKVGTDYYIAMEYVHGRDLGDVLDRAYERGEPMPTQLGLYIAEKLLDGLDYAHKLTDERGRHMGLVHRDISPQNVLIGFDGSVKLIDFGLARTDILPGRTQGALAVGKYGYMSPEQARHEKIDGRADIYSTGVMLFEVFTGDRLVDEQDQATLWSRVLSPKHRKPSTVIQTLPSEIDDLVMTAVAVSQDNRFGDAAEMRRFVQSLRNQTSNRDDFVRYLHYLYPKVEFAPPPVPDFRGMFDDSEKSMIIATSREGALSVFGRGDLPIEWTTQIDAAELQALVHREGRGSRAPYLPEILQEAPVTDAEEPLSPDMPVEPTRVKTRGDDGRRGKGEPTQVSRGEELSAIETRYGRNPRVEDEETPARAGVDLATEHLTPALGKSRVAQQFRDDEMTVMMDAPPRHLVVRPTDEFIDEETREGNAPTRQSHDPVVQTPAPVVVSSRRIQEKNSVHRRDEARTNLRDRTDRATEKPAGDRIPDRQADRAGDRIPDRQADRGTDRAPDRGSDRTADRADRGQDRGRGDNKGARPAGRAVAHKATVPSEAHSVHPHPHSIAPPKRSEDTMPPAGAPEATLGERERPVGVLPIIILAALAVVIVLLVVLLLRV